MPAESKKLDKTCPEPFGGKSGGWVLLYLIVLEDVKQSCKILVDVLQARWFGPLILGISIRECIAHCAMVFLPIQLSKSIWKYPIEFQNWKGLIF